MSTWITLIVAIVGALLGTGFIQFLITRADKKRERAEDKEENNIKKELKAHLDNVSTQWKIDYCDVNTKAIKDLDKKVYKLIETKENQNNELFKKHEKAVEEIQKEISILVDYNAKQTEYMKKMGQNLLGLSHDKIVYLGDIYIERGAITLKEKATILSIYEPYKKLGGNGDCEIIFNYIDKLPIISEEEAKKRDKEKFYNVRTAI